MPFLVNLKKLSFSWHKKLKYIKLFSRLPSKKQYVLNCNEIIYIITLHFGNIAKIHLYFMFHLIAKIFK